MVFNLTNNASLNGQNGGFTALNGRRRSHEHQGALALENRSERCIDRFGLQITDVPLKGGQIVKLSTTGVVLARIAVLMGGRAAEDLIFNTFTTGAGNDRGRTQLCPDWRALMLKFPDRFLIGSDTWVNQRWQYYEALMQEYRSWLGDLPPAVARQVAWGNAAGLFGLQAEPAPRP